METHGPTTAGSAVEVGFVTGAGLGRGRHDNLGIGEGTWTRRATTQALLAVGAYVAEDPSRPRRNDGDRCCAEPRCV